VPVWQFDSFLGPEDFAKLRFRLISDGIARAHRENYAAWRAHEETNRAFIEQAAAKLQQRELAIVLGAGHAFDLPLVALSRLFGRLVLVDVDESALESMVRAVFKDRGSVSHVEPRVMDLAGLNAKLVPRIDEVLENSASAEEADVRLAQLCRSAHLPPPGVRLTECLGGRARADFVVSSCVLSQIAWPQRYYAQGLYEKRFGPLRGEAEHKFIVPWREFELRAQQDHINGIGLAADVFVLTSDTVNHPTAYDSAGVERPTGHRIFPMAVEWLAERIPRGFAIARSAAWQWHRYRPKGGVQGGRMDVEGVVLHGSGQHQTGGWASEADR
jgi:hypothetical protein